MTSPLKLLASAFFVESKLANGPIISLEKSARKAGGTSHACRLVHPVNVDHLKVLVFPNRISGDDGLFAAEMLGYVEGTALPIMRLGVRDTEKIYASEPFSHGQCVDSRGVYNL